MATRRRSGSRSGSFSTSHTTPAQGLASPARMEDALADMGAQLKDFAQEVRELKALVRELGGSVAGAGSSATTDRIDIDDFRRSLWRRRLVLGSCLALPMLLFTIWAMLPGAPTEGTKPAIGGASEWAPAQVASAVRAPRREDSPGSSPEPAAKPASPGAAPDKVDKADKAAPALRPAGRSTPQGASAVADSVAPAATRREPRASRRTETHVAKPVFADQAPTTKRSSFETSGGVPILE